MIAFAAALLLVPQVQDEDRLRDAWPKLVDAWKAADAYKPSPDTDGADEFLKLAGKLHGAFEAADLYGSEGEYVPRAFKTFVKTRFRWLTSVRPGSSRVSYNWNSQGPDPMQSFLDSITRLRTLEQGGLDDEDNVQDELATARKALKSMGVTADDTPSPLRRRVLALARALAQGDAYPAPARATEEQAKAIKACITGLSHESIEEREKATRDLQKFGEAALPFLREAAIGGDAEAASRAKKLLGVGHAPWTALAAQDPKTRRIHELSDALGDFKRAMDEKAADEAERAKRK